MGALAITATIPAFGCVGSSAIARAMRSEGLNQCIAESIGTFVLVLTVGCTGIAAGPDVIPALAIGSALMVMIGAGGRVSGAHQDPAVTVAVFLRGRCAAADVVPCWIAQLAGAASASGILLAFKTAKAITFDANVPAAFVSGALSTFALAFVVRHVAIAKATAGNSSFGLAIGFTVLVGAFAVGHVSGGAFHPLSRSAP